MTEKQKMLAGQAYNSRDPELIEAYHKARKLFHEYNALASDQADCDYGENICIGENTFINMNCIFLDDNKITIGKNGLIAPCVQIYTATHPLKATERIRPQEDQDGDQASYLTLTKPVTIGDNTWVGGNTVIMPGVEIGNNVTIGAGSVVTKSIPDNVLAFGNPCKVVKTL